MAVTSSPFLLSFLLLSSLSVLFLLAPRFLPPKTLPPIPLPDELDDLALFRRATLSDDDAMDPSRRRRLPPPPRTGKKIAFLFLTNSNLSFAPLWELFFHGHAKLFNIYIHADPNVNPPVPPTPGVFRHRFIQAKSTQRASPTLISAARRLMAAALLDDPLNAFFAIVSQHCVPLHSFGFVYRTLSHGEEKSYIEIVEGDGGLWERYVARGEEAMMPEVPFERFRVGSQFFVLTRRHAVMVVRDRVLWRKFRMPCLKAREESCYPEEHYFPTLLSMRDPEGCAGYTLTRVNWTGSVGGHPHTYRPGEVSGELVQELRKSNTTYSYLFARKFSPDCLQSLLRIATSVIFAD